MERSIVKSDELNSVGYDQNSNTLEIEFENGVINQYLEVPESLYNEFMNSNLKAEFFKENIANIYLFR